MTITAKTHGYDFNFFKKVTVTNSAYGTSEDVLINIPGQVQGFSLSNETGSTIVNVSFNGTTDHEQLDSSLTTKFVQYNDRPVFAMWMKLTSGSSAVVCVRAWGTR